MLKCRSKCLFLLFGMILSSFVSCKQDYTKQKVSSLVQEWIGREMSFPKSLVYTIQMTDTITDIMESPHLYTIINYIDTTGCTSCKLQLPMWKHLMEELETAAPNRIGLYFFLYPKDLHELRYTLKVNEFMYPVCIDLEDSFNKLNKLPSETRYRTFLINKDNRVLAVGNPVHNPKVKELYLKIIRGENVSQEEETSRTQTTMEVDRTEADMGRFDWREEQTAEFVLKNTGRHPLVIFDVRTSCGCTHVEYDTKPTRPGDSLVLRVTYKADSPGHFRKEVTVRSNAEQELLKLTVTGEAEERK